MIVSDQGSPSEKVSSKLRLPKCSEMLKFGGGEEPADEAEWEGKCLFSRRVFHKEVT